MLDKENLLHYYFIKITVFFFFYLFKGSRDPSTNVLKFGLCNYSAHMKDLSQEQWNHLYNIGCH